MYAHCLFCNAGLGRNEALEAFPVGRRLAYDADRGRLWVVCGACRRWNLTPLEQRWEAIEQAERLYRGTRLRASTDNVGLARVADGVDFVRIGTPLRPEIVAWRYGREFVRRRRVVQAVEAARWGVLAALVFAFGGVALFGLNFDALSSDLGGATPDASESENAISHTARVRVAGVFVHVAVEAAAARLIAGPDGSAAVAVPWGRGERILAGADAYRVLGGLMRSINHRGARAAEVEFAVQRLGRVQDLATFLRSIEHRTIEGARVRRPSEARDRRRGLLALSGTDRLALEIVLHEDAERRAMDGELAELERAWRDAEEIAAIADSLALPRAVEAAWERLRDRARP